MNKILLFTLTLFSCSFFGQQSELWGCSYGGGTGAGTIFKTDVDGENHQIINNFEYNFGGNPELNDLCQGSNGLLYGLTSQGGKGGGGTLFEYNPVSEEHNVLYHFVDAAPEGDSPRGGLTEVGNNVFYGVASEGGANSEGVLFKFDVSTNTLTTLFSFDDVNSGRSPYADVTHVGGYLYGTTWNGGVNDAGTIFKYHIATNVFTKLHDFDDVNGKYPSGELLHASNGKLYGVTYFGGSSYLGVIYEYDIQNDIFTKKCDLGTIQSAGKSRSKLIEGTSGKLYGMTLDGGNSDDGIIFEFNTTTSAFTTVYQFNGVASGSAPRGSLVYTSTGKLYGATSEGGANNLGTFFEYNVTTASFSKKFDFDGVNNGASPFGSSPLLATNGKIYSLTRDGGLANDGVLYEYNVATNVVEKKVDFNFGIEGVFPSGSLTQASNGKLYGVTRIGGTANLGTLYEYDFQSNSFAKKIDFQSSASGESPIGELVNGANNKLYGLASGGLGYGVIYEYDVVTNVYTKKIDFDSVNTGEDPISLILANNGKMIGVTAEGGVNQFGVLFEYDASTNVLTKKIDFDGVNKGAYPYGDLMQASNGLVYGMTYSGGNDDVGVIFSYNPSSSSFAKLFDFTNGTGVKYPGNGLVEASNGLLYGCSEGGGTSSFGTLFSFDISTNTVTKKVDFIGLNGKYPSGSLLQSSNGNFYGMCRIGGANGKGNIFEFDPINDVFTTKLDFDVTNGSIGDAGNLIEVINTSSNLLDNKDKSSLSFYPNPSNSIVSFSSENAIELIMVYNIAGQKIGQFNNTNTIDISSFPTGTYTAKVNSASKTEVIKLIRE